MVFKGPGIQTIPALGPQVYQYFLHCLIWILRVLGLPQQAWLGERVQAAVAKKVLEAT